MDRETGKIYKCQILELEEEFALVEYNHKFLNKRQKIDKFSFLKNN